MSDEFDHLVSRDRWLLLEGFMTGYESGHHDTVESQYSDARACGNDWLDDMAADGVTVEMVLIKDAPPDYTLTTTITQQQADMRVLAEAVLRNHGNNDMTFVDPPFIMPRVCNCSDCTIARKVIEDSL